MNLLPKTLAGIAGISVTIWCGWTSWVLFVGGTLPVVGETVSGNPVRGLMFFIVVEPVVGAVAVFGTFFLVHLLQAPLTLAIALIRELRREVTPFERQQHELIRSEAQLARAIRNWARSSEPVTDPNDLVPDRLYLVGPSLGRFTDRYWKRSRGNWSSRHLREADHDKEWFVFRRVGLGEGYKGDPSMLDRDDVLRLVRDVRADHVELEDMYALAESLDGLKRSSLEDASEA